MRFIPRKTKVKMEFFKGVTLSDIIIGFIGVAGLILIATSNFEYNYAFAISWASILVTLFMPVSDDLRLYYTIVLLFRFSAFKRKYSKVDEDRHADIKELIPYKGIYNGKYLKYDNYYAQVIEIQPKEFFLLTEQKQNQLIDIFANALRRLTAAQTASLIKVNKPLLLDEYIQNEDRKYETVLEMGDKGEIDKEELEARSMVFENRVSTMNYINTVERTYKDHFYLVIYDSDKVMLESTVNGMISYMMNSPIPIYSRYLQEKELAVFLKANYTKDFDERQLEGMPMEKVIDWTMPKNVTFRTAQTLVDGKVYRAFNITDYPINVRNAWAYDLFAMPNTKAVVNIKPILKYEAEKLIDKAIIEMESKTAYSAKTSTQIENETHLTTLKELLVQLKTGNENLFDVNFFLTCEDNMKKEMRALLKQEGFKYSEMFGRQVDAFISSNISRLDTVNENKRGVHTSSVAAMFPFISSALMDRGGFYIGHNDFGPVFVNFFMRNNERINSNLMIIGKSGSGKSFATKTLLANLAADNSKIFILDPENEYEILTENLKGQAIDVGTGMQGRINPFHITPSLQGEGVTVSDDYSSHLQFLEQFFRVILEGISPDAFEKVNTLVVEMYTEKGINQGTDISTLKPTDFPVFDDLYRIINTKVKAEKDEYLRRMYQIIQTYIQKFSSGGRNSNLWNGATTLETKENFVTFSFRSLLANNNMVIANAQMMLVLRYLNNEIIKNREFNNMMGFEEEDPNRRKVIITVDEAHVFINPNYPIALNFMEQMAKRIRKYSGMQIIITQNIKDFVGSEDIARQSAAVINASQYSMIFGLSPNDMSDLVDLYRNAGGINEDEQDAIATAGRGDAFLITSPLSRTSVSIVALPPVRKLFEKRKKDKPEEEEE
ncbi:MAG: VirB4 family type IV secretion system protein [Spirochaetales bacterium]